MCVMYYKSTQTITTKTKDNTRQEKTLKHQHKSSKRWRTPTNQYEQDKTSKRMQSCMSQKANRRPWWTLSYLQVHSAKQWCGWRQYGWRFSSVFRFFRFFDASSGSSLFSSLADASWAWENLSLVRTGLCRMAIPVRSNPPGSSWRRLDRVTME